MDVDVKPTNEDEGEKEGRHRIKDKKRHADAIDDIFSSSGKVKKRKRGDDESAPVVSTKPVEAKPAPVAPVADKGLKDILGAIKDVPKGQALREGSRHKKGKK